MNKKVNEFKFIIILIIIFLILLGIYLICSLLNDKNKNVETHIVNINYKLVDSVNDFKLYELYGDDYNVNLNNVLIEYKNYKLYINGLDIKDSIILDNRIAFIGDSVLFIITDINTQTNAILLYNRAERNSVIIDKIDGMFIINTDFIELFEAGIRLQISNCTNNVLKIDNKIYDLCKYKKNDVIYKELIYFYDYPSNSFNSMDIIKTMKVKDYKKYYCE